MAASSRLSSSCPRRMVKASSFCRPQGLQAERALVLAAVAPTSHSTRRSHRQGRQLPASAGAGVRV